MCNGDSTRLSLGGSIAVLKPVCKPGRPTLRREISIRLIAVVRNGRTKAVIDGWENNEKVGSEILIHQDGDLRLETTSDSSVLHRLALPNDSKPGAMFEINARLNLCVGGEGIIGRRVSLMDCEDCVGTGIMGWN